MKRMTVAALLVMAVASSAALVGQRTMGAAADPAGDAAKTAEPVAAKSKIDSVTVYLGQALVTRVVDMPAAAGLSEVLVSELPARIVPGSIFAESSDGVEVRSIRYRERAVPTDVREDVRKLDEQIRKYNDLIAANQKQIQVLADQQAYLDKLANFTAPTATTEMSKGVLNAEQLKGLTNYQFESRKTISDTSFKMTLDQRDLREAMSVLERQRDEITSRSSKTVREAVVFVNQEKAGGTLKVRYVVDSASWSPSYNIRADADRKNAVVEYQAQIQQMSGEDWGDVQMTLSTATPNIIAAAPMLNPLTISLSMRGSADVAAGESVAGKLDYKAAKSELYEQRRQAEGQRNTSNGQFGQQSGGGGANGGGLFTNNATNFNNNRDNDLNLNKVADQLQVLELLAKDGRKDEEDRRMNGHEGIVVSYALKTRTSLPSRSDQQLIQIQSVPVKSIFYKVAIPVLTAYVYDQATLTNTSNVVLLAGPVSSYVGGQFVGNGDIATVAIGQTFTVGFGIDSSLRATRERLEKAESVQGGNKVINYTFKLAVENFGTQAADVRIMDRLPTAKDTEVKVNFTDSDTAKISTDADYLSMERTKGLLRWDVQVPAQKNRSEAYSITYKMNMEYDKNLGISASAGMKLQDMERDLLKQMQLDATQK